MTKGTTLNHIKISQCGKVIGISFFSLCQKLFIIFIYNGPCAYPDLIYIRSWDTNLEHTYCALVFSGIYGAFKKIISDIHSSINTYTDIKSKHLKFDQYSYLWNSLVYLIEDCESKLQSMFRLVCPFYLPIEGNL